MALAAHRLAELVHKLSENGVASIGFNMVFPPSPDRR